MILALCIAAYLIAGIALVKCKAVCPIEPLNTTEAGFLAVLAPPIGIFFVVSGLVLLPLWLLGVLAKPKEKA